MLSDTAPISVVIPVHNRADLLAATLANIQEQTLAPAEIVVIDDGSTDASAAVAQQFGTQLIRLPNRLGVSAARNIGLLAACQPWIAFLDSDDLWAPTKLARQWEAIQAANHEADFIFSDFSQFQATPTAEHVEIHQSVLRSNHDRPAAEIDPHILDIRAAYAQVAKEPIATGIARCTTDSLQRALIQYGGYILTSSVLVRRALFLRAGLFDTTLDITEDWDMFLRLSLSMRALVVEETLVRYRRHMHNTSGNFIQAMKFHALLVEKGIKRPELYPPGFQEYWKSKLPPRLDLAAKAGIREGEFATAKKFLRQRLNYHPSPGAVGLLSLTTIADSGAGQWLYVAARQIKRTLRPPRRAQT